jgi:hypothetical protein
VTVLVLAVVVVQLGQSGPPRILPLQGADAKVGSVLSDLTVPNDFATRGSIDSLARAGRPIAARWDTLAE